MVHRFWVQRFWVQGSKVLGSGFKGSEVEIIGVQCSDVSKQFVGDSS
jgi:hypothetical protein